MMDEQAVFFDKMCDDISPIFWYFEILQKFEEEKDAEKKIKQLHLLQELKEVSILNVEKVRTLLHNGF